MAKKNVFQSLNSYGPWLSIQMAMKLATKYSYFLIQMG